EGEAHDLRRRDLQDLSELADRDELVDANELLLALDLGGAHGLRLFAHATTIDAAATRGSSTHGCHRLRDVRIHSFLIHRPALALLPSASRRAGAGRRTAGRRGTATR